MESAPELSEAAKSLKPGIYRHFKGGEYQVFGVERNSETGAEEVEYVSLDQPGEHRRNVEEFLEDVDREDYGYQGPRFTYVRPVGK